MVELQIGCPLPLEITATVKVGNSQRWEREIHGRLADYAVLGEWFELTETRLAQLMQGLEILRAKWEIRS